MRKVFGDVAAVVLLDGYGTDRPADRDVWTAIPGVDGVQRGGVPWVVHIGNHAEDSCTALACGRMDGGQHGDVIPPLAEVSVDDQPRGWGRRGARRRRGDAHDHR